MMDFVSGLRQVVQDLLIPEFRSLQTEVHYLNEKLDRLASETSQRFEEMNHRFAKIDQRFEALSRETNQRFDEVHQEIMALVKTAATMDGKLDILVNHIVDYKEATRVSVRLEHLEKRVGDLDATVRTLTSPPGASRP